MEVVIRLQGLRITAGSEDIRFFFTGLKIPDGGVHIIGGERQEAFIIFASDEDARRAMTRSGGSIKDSQVHLLLSSRSEMQSIIEDSTKKPEVIQQRPYKKGYKRPQRECTIEEPQRKRYLEMRRRSYGDTLSLAQKPSSQASSRDDLYLILIGMPFTTTKENVRSFFDGLAIDDLVLMKNYRGQLNGKGIVKFKSIMDATEGLKRDRNYIGTRFVEVYPSSEDKWFKAVGGIEPGKDSSGKYRRGSSPAHSAWDPDHARSRSPVAYRSTKSSSPQNEDYCVLVENLPYSVQKKDIKVLFHPASLKYDQILHLHDGYGKKTRCVFVLFGNLRDYCAALTHNKEVFLNRYVHVSPISKEKMVAMLESSENPRDCRSPSVRSRSRSEESLPIQKEDSYECEKICLYVRNLPFDVRKVEIVDFFVGFKVSEENVVLLCDSKGNGLGEALVIFQSEEEAMRAQSLNGQGFLGANVILKCISLAQMREFGVEPVITESKMTGQRASEGFSARNSETETHSYTNFVVDPDMGHLQMNDLQVHIHRGSSLGLDSNRMESPAVLDEDNGYARGHGAHGTSRSQEFDGPTCIKLINLPSTIKIDEIYDFCYGYRVIPGSVSLQHNSKGIPKGSATVVFDSRQEALTAVGELNGRPIGSKKVKLAFV